MTDMTTIEVDIPDDVFIALAKMAHEKGITLNELVTEILQNYIDGKIAIDQDEHEVELRKATANIVSGGVTIETLSRYSRAYLRWFEEGGYNGKRLPQIIQDGFDLADELDEKENT
jgi:hypothetical protein